MSKIHLAFLWHQHQPVYKNPLTGVYDMPWVRLHATKDYYDMAAILDDFPAIKFNINLVPSLIKQLEEYATKKAKDKFIDITLTPADSISEDELVFLLQNFFMANFETMIKPYPRYTALLLKRGKHTNIQELKRRASYFKKQDILDLQVWFNLTWVDPYWRIKDPFIKQLFEKGENFTEEEKVLLIDKHIQICGAVVPKHKEIQDRHQAEISTSPFYHPILPLLCDTNSALVAMPNVKLPKNRFKHPEDARIHIKRAVELYKEIFGCLPKGFWPSEGSVSEEVVKIFSEFGINWIASDEEVLFKSDLEHIDESKLNLYEPYRVEVSGGSINMVFRDHAISDAIGFVYSKWSTKDAVDDFLSRVYGIQKSLPEDEEHLISVILDGENCWEYYPNDGRDFLYELFSRISKDKNIVTTTISEYLKKHPPKKRLKKLHAGSWIRSNFGVWIGHDEDNLAWDYLYEARKFLVGYVKKNPSRSDSPELKSAWEYLYIAEGSDWNWWYGDDHSSSYNFTFDYLFRANLQKVYETLGEKPPEYLHIAIKGKQKRVFLLEPVDFLKVKIDGRVTNYFEWLYAGYYLTGRSGGSMHQVESLIGAIYYGFDLQNLYLRFDTEVLKEPEKLSQLCFHIRFLSPKDRECQFCFDSELNIKKAQMTTQGKFYNLTERFEAKAQKIIELALSFEVLETKVGNRIEFIVAVTKDGNEIERWPYQSSIVITHPSEDYFSRIWSA